MSKQSSPSTTLHYHKDYQSQPRSNRESLVNTARFKTPVDGTDEGDLGTVQPNMQEVLSKHSFCEETYSTCSYLDDNIFI